jgi:hypothetical protein
MEYWILVSYSPSELIEEVNALIAKGWRPQGGVAARGDNGVQYLQAMVRGE